MYEIFGIIFLTVVLPLLIIGHYVTRWRSTKALTHADERMLEEVWENAQKMESRINAMETILDDEVPDWRKKV
ncbi:MAG: envelope stress response membrane protein PspB [Gammaproteobacteria bacterium]|nr:envelope stress response membrane protein PspB [Gammaproteobacteria bacterium]NNF62312.1 envelope stress response membrane protein PspB [Gammaproteobacteria bacterium]NNM20876.1 envelope stress response membrane protein PspB [Gammaproteobacteria bacterium]